MGEDMQVEERKQNGTWVSRFQFHETDGVSMIPFGRVGERAQRALPKWCQRRALASQAPSKRVIFSGIQPTGIPHVGGDEPLSRFKLTYA